MKTLKLGSLKDGNKAICLLNPERLTLTPEILRELSGLDVSDEKAAEIIDSIRMFCNVLYQFSNSQKKSYFDDSSHDTISHNIQNLAA